MKNRFLVNIQKDTILDVYYWSLRYGNGKLLAQSKIYKTRREAVAAGRHVSGHLSGSQFNYPRK